MDDQRPDSGNMSWGAPGSRYSNDHSRSTLGSADPGPYAQRQVPSILDWNSGRQAAANEPSSYGGGGGYQRSGGYDHDERFQQSSYGSAQPLMGPPSRDNPYDNQHPPRLGASVSSEWNDNQGGGGGAAWQRPPMGARSDLMHDTAPAYQQHQQWSGAGDSSHGGRVGLPAPSSAATPSWDSAGGMSRPGNDSPLIGGDQSSDQTDTVSLLLNLSQLLA